MELTVIESATDVTASADTASENTSPLDRETDGETIDLSDQVLYINRELSHLAFNLRVLAQSTDERHPLLERLRFLLIFSSNLDEFYEIRVADLKKQVDFGREQPGADGLPPRDVMDEINARVQDANRELYDTFHNVLLPELADENIHFLRRSLWTPEQTEWARQYFISEVQPVISPLGLDPARPFPRLVNKNLNFILSLEGGDAFGRESGLAIVPAPRSLPRLIKLPDELCEGGDNFVFLTSIIHANVDELFPGMVVKQCHQFRLTRNADLNLALEVDDVASAFKGELHRRRFGAEVKFEIDAQCPEHLCQFLLGSSALVKSRCSVLMVR